MPRRAPWRGTKPCRAARHGAAPSRGRARRRQCKCMPRHCHFCVTRGHAAPGTMAWHEGLPRRSPWRGILSTDTTQRQCKCMPRHRSSWRRNVWCRAEYPGVACLPRPFPWRGTCVCRACANGVARSSYLTENNRKYMKRRHQIHRHMTHRHQMTAN